MATFFGEVLPVRSRAVDDDEDKDIPIEELFLENKPNSLQNCSLFICSIGSNASTFNEIFVLPSDAQLLTHVRSGTKLEENDHEHFMGLYYRRSPKLVGSLYNKESVLFFICREKVLVEQAIPLANKLMDLVSSPNVLILCDYYSSEYKHNYNEILQVPFLRSLHTSKFSVRDCNIPLLKQPNTVSGFEAALLTECEIRNIAAELIVCFTDQCCLDLNCVKSFLRIFSIPCVKNNTLQANPDAERQVKEIFINRLSISDTLYS